MDTWERNGVTIGDVGYIDIVNGSFQSLFNIFFDERKPGDPVAKIPDNFTPIKPPLAGWDVRLTPDYFSKGAVVTSTDVETTKVSEDKMYVQDDVVYVSAH